MCGHMHLSEYFGAYAFNIKLSTKHNNSERNACCKQGACGSKLCHESADILLPGRRQRKRTAYPCTRSLLTAGKRLCAVCRWILYTVEGVQYSSVGHGPRELQTTTPGLMSVYVWIESPSAPREDLYKPPRTRRFWASFKFSSRAFSCQKCNAVMLYTSEGSHHGSISRHYA